MSRASKAVAQAREAARLIAADLSESEEIEFWDELATQAADERDQAEDAEAEAHVYPDEYDHGCA